MTKRKRSDPDIDSVFDQIAAATSEVQVDGTLSGLLIRLKPQILSAALAAERKHGVKKPAGDFTLEEAVDAFGLKYSTVVSTETMAKQTWKIEELPEAQSFQMTPCFPSLVENYSKNFDRSSKAVCRTAIDLILNECLIVMKGNHPEPGVEATTIRGRKTPTPWDDIKVYGKVSFSHNITPRTTTASGKPATIVTGRVDHSIGRVIRSPVRPAAKQFGRRFQSLLLIVEAKIARSVDQALPQLFTYLASLHQSRPQRHRSDASVYGVASDGYIFIFVTISHDGAVKLSRRFDITQGDLLTVLGCLKYVLEMTANMIPNLMPERSGRQEEGDADDPAIDLDDNDYTHPPRDDEVFGLNPRRIIPLYSALNTPQLTKKRPATISGDVASQNGVSAPTSTPGSLALSVSRSLRRQRTD